MPYLVVCATNNNTTQSVIQERLLHAGHEVIMVNSGTKALKEIARLKQEGRTPLLLADTDLLRDIQREQPHMKVPVILMSGQEQPDIKCDAFIYKGDSEAFRNMLDAIERLSAERGVSEANSPAAGAGMQGPT